MATAVGTNAAVIANAGHSRYVIVTPDQKSPAVGYAANELQSFLRRISGVKLPIVTESKAGAAPAFLLGPCKKSVKAGLTDRASKLREDGVLIKSLGSGDIALLGQNERGNLYSVYVLLEKYLGVRFLAWDCTVVPKHRELTLPAIDYSYAPPFMYRETLYWNSFPKQIAARQRLNGPWSKCDATTGGKIELYPYVHSSNALVPPSEYFKDHPEYYSLQKGKRVTGDVHAQLCLTNPDVLRLAKAKVLKWIEENPDVPIIDVSQNDGNGWCECDKCMAVVKEEGSQHGPILRFVNAIADEVAKKYPDKWIETLAYAYSTKPPAITRPRPNVIIRLCHAGCFFHGFEQCGLGANFASYLDQWSKLTKRIFIWHYATNFAHYLAPNQNLEGLAKDLKYYGTHNVNGVMVQCDYQSPGGELAELREYLAAQLMWDPTQDPMKIRREFCDGYYGKASKYVQAFLSIMDKAAQNPSVHAFAAWDPKSTVSPTLVNDSLAMLNKAKTAADNPTISNRIDKLMLPFWYMELTYPDVYGASTEELRSVLKQTKQVIVRNHITHVREGGDSAPQWLADMDLQFAPLPPNVVSDLTQISGAKTTNCADWRAATVERDGKTLRSVFQHPDGIHDGDATYDITLPAADGRKILMTFATVITAKTVDGVRFSVLVDGKELWNETKTTYLSADSTPKSAQDNVLPGQNPFSDHTIDLSAYAGKKISLTLRVNALADGSNDWANWVEPKIILSK